MTTTTIAASLVVLAMPIRRADVSAADTASAGAPQRREGAAERTGMPKLLHLDLSPLRD
jgi:hypothetical protein